MRKIATIKENDRKALFQNTAAKMGLTNAIIEKDFWVCFMLDYLFHRCEWKNHIAFKGGTSLSKSYGLIERFSEDIDLILDWRVIGFCLDEPWEERSNTKQECCKLHPSIADPHPRCFRQLCIKNSLYTHECTR